MARPYLLTPPQPITVEIRTGDGGVLTVTGTLNAVPQSAGQVALTLAVINASMEMTVPGHEPEPDR
jgi:hypothetical protein